MDKRKQLILQKKQKKFIIKLSNVKFHPYLIKIHVALVFLFVCIANSVDIKSNYGEDRMLLIKERINVNVKSTAINICYWL